MQKMQKFDHNIGFWEKRRFVHENCRKSPKIVITKLWPLDKAIKIRGFQTPIWGFQNTNMAEHLDKAIKIWVFQNMVDLLTLKIGQCHICLLRAVYTKHRLIQFLQMSNQFRQNPLYNFNRYILWLFGIFYGHLVYFSVWACCTEKHLATLRVCM
jgi:hypothetical protein